MSDEASAESTAHPTIEDVEREVRLARARRLAEAKSREVTLRADPEAREVLPSRGDLPARIDDPASPIPYLAATGVTLAAMLAGVFGLGLSALPVATWGLTFLGVSMVLKRMDDVPPDHPNGLVRWVGDRVERLRDTFGIELYGVMSLTAFIQYEVASLSSSSIPLQRILTDIPGGLAEYMIREVIESFGNMVQAFLWWMPLFGSGWQFAVPIVAAAWAVLWVLDMPVGGQTRETSDAIAGGDSGE